MTDEQVYAMLFDELYAEPGLRRKELIEKCVSRLGFTAEQLADCSTDSPVIRTKSRLGMLLSACMLCWILPNQP